MSIRGKSVGNPVVATPGDNIEKVGNPEDAASNCVKLSELSSREEGLSDSR